MKVICAICSKEFETQGGNVKYCSTNCKREGQRQRRKEWEVRTGYKEKQRQAAIYHRAEQARQVEEEAKEATRKKKSAETKAKRKKKRNAVAELEKKAAEGNKWALARLALKEGKVLEYWCLRKELVQEEDEKARLVSNVIVGGLSVYEDNFECKIMEQLKYKNQI